MANRCSICASGRASEVDELLHAGLSFVKIQNTTGFGRTTVGRHKSHISAPNVLALKSNSVMQPDESSGNDLVAQYARLKMMLTDAIKSRPVDYALHLKIESELAKNLKTQTAFFAAQSKQIKPIYPDTAIRAEISSLASKLAVAVSKYPKAKAAILKLLKPYTDKDDISGAIMNESPRQ